MTQTVPITRFVRAYLRASTEEQDAERARGMLDRFAQEQGIVICNYYVENESGARLKRPELFRLLRDSRPSDVLLVEDVDRLSRLSAADWEKLKRAIRQRQVRVVAVNVPTTWQHLAPKQGEFDSRIFAALNDMMLDMLAAIARRDYEQRRERQAQGIAKAKAAGKYRGRKIDKNRYDAINRLLASGSSWSVVQRTVGCSRSTISNAVKHAGRVAGGAFNDKPEAIPSVTALLHVYVENGSKFTRGKKRAREDIEDLVTVDYGGSKLSDTEYRIVFQYDGDADLKQQIDGLIDDIQDAADLRNCIVDDLSIRNEANGQYWDDYNGGWR